MLDNAVSLLSNDSRHTNWDVAFTMEDVSVHIFLPSASRWLFHFSGRSRNRVFKHSWQRDYSLPISFLWRTANCSNWAWWDCSSGLVCWKNSKSIDTDLRVLENCSSIGKHFLSNNTVPSSLHCTPSGRGNVRCWIPLYDYGLQQCIIMLILFQHCMLFLQDK